MRILIILVDGLRPDAIPHCERAMKICERGAYTPNGKTVMPSVTLPCHMSLFHSVDPTRHGTTTNTYMPQVRPIDGICEVLLQNKKKSAFFYNWEELRDLARPNSLTFSYFCKGRDIGYDKANDIVTEAAAEYLCNNHVDFAFLYLGYTDMAGHDSGWMSEHYFEAVENSFKNIEMIIDKLPKDYTVFITADHGGHDRTHGSDLPEDMDIPLIAIGEGFDKSKSLDGYNIKDLAPTVTNLLGIAPDPEWEGTSLA